jgi:hypothetical protein
MKRYVWPNQNNLFVNNTTMSLYRIAGTITFILIGLAAFGVAAIPGWFTGIFAILAAIGLGAGV